MTLPAVLQSHGFDVRSAASVAEALAEVKTHKFDVLLSDLNIDQENDGFTIVHAAREAQCDSRPLFCNASLSRELTY